MKMVINPAAGRVPLLLCLRVSRLQLINLCLNLCETLVIRSKRFVELFGLQEYVRGVLESPPLQHDMEQNIRGVAVKGINLGFLKELKMPACSRAQQDRLGEMYRQSDRSKLELRRTLAETTALFNRIIQDNLT